MMTANPIWLIVLCCVCGLFGCWIGWVGGLAEGRERAAQEGKSHG